MSVKKFLSTPAMLAFLALRASAQDPAAGYPESYKVLLENDRVRVLEFRLTRGSRESFHAHPAHVAYVLSGFKLRFTFPDGSTAIRETKDGDVLFSEATIHASENIGDADAHGLLVESKGGTGAAPSTMDPSEWLTAVTFITGKPGKEGELERELRALSAPTRAEPGNVAYDLYQSAEKPNEFLRFEIWRSPEALEAHKQTPHLKASFQKRIEQGWMTEITLWKRVPGDAPLAGAKGESR